MLRQCRLLVTIALLSPLVQVATGQGPPEVVVSRPPVVYVNVTEGSARGCEDNEIYIVDGERTLIITNNKMARDIDHIQVRNLAS